MTQLPAVPNSDRELVKEIAMDIGKAAVSHLRLMYPDAANALGKSGQLSLRNTVFNEIIAAIDVIDANDIRSRLERRKRHRREMHRLHSIYARAAP